MPVVVVGISHRTTPVEIREQFAIADTDVPKLLEDLRKICGVDEGVVLSTCNRVEIYAATDLPETQAIARVKEHFIGNRPLQKDDHIYTMGEPRSLEHLFKVAAGLDSMVLGETEILGQLKKAYEVALQSRFTGSKLNKAFQRAFNVAKHIRTHTNIQRGSVSVASVSVELAEKIFGSLAERTVMVMGAGDTSEKTARALLSRGAQSLVVANRSYERAEALAKELGGHAVSFDKWHEQLAQIDIAISSTSAPNYVLEKQMLSGIMKLRHYRPLLLIDIAVPRDIEPKVNSLEGVYLYNIDDLQAIADDYMKQRREEIAQCENIIAEKVKALLSPLPHP